jgi:hypothetical protein
MGSDPTSINSSMLQLYSLQLEFTNVMTQYKQAYATYISDLQNTSSTPSFTVIPGKSFWGSYAVNQHSSPSTSNCIALCSANSKCTGATFNSATQLCYLRGGTGMIGPGSATDSAIITKTNNDVANVQALNQQLLDLTNEMNTLLISTQPSVEQETIDKNIQKQQLASIYSNLISERTKISNMNQEYQDATQQYNDNSLYVSTASSQHLVWGLIFIVVILITIKYIFFSDFKINAGKVTYWSIIICIFIFLMLNMQSQSAYGICLLLIAFLLLQQFKLLPTM